MSGASNETCHFCGGEIIFRIIRGVTTPIHVGDTKCIGRSLFRRDREGVPFETQCPRCQGNVIFLRHNGGSVWLDSLGWPWPKHGCFLEETTAAMARVFPESALSLEGGRHCYAKSLGRLKSKEGIVLYLRTKRKEFRQDPKYHKGSQWLLVCKEDDFDALEAFFDKIPVVFSRKLDRLITLDGLEFKVTQHRPVYSSWPPPPHT